MVADPSVCHGCGVQIAVGMDPRDPRGAVPENARPTPLLAGSTSFTTTTALASKVRETELKQTIARAKRATETADLGDEADEVVEVPDGLGGTVVMRVASIPERERKFTESFPRREASILRG
jgi:hypothetical protein